MRLFEKDKTLEKEHAALLEKDNAALLVKIHRRNMQIKHLKDRLKHICVTVWRGCVEKVTAGGSTHGIEYTVNDKDTEGR